jgi:hypothetical protein
MLQFRRADRFLAEILRTATDDGILCSQAGEDTERTKGSAREMHSVDCTSFKKSLPGWEMRHADVRTTLRVYSHLLSETHVDIMEKPGQRSIGTNVPISTGVVA